MNNRQVCYLNPTNLSKQEAELLYKLILHVDPNKAVLMDGDEVQIQDIIYKLKLTYPIHIIKKPHDKHLIINLEVIEHLHPNWYYQDEMSSYNSEPDFSFLYIFRNHGRLNIVDNSLQYVPYASFNLKFHSMEIIDLKMATLAQRLFLDDVFTMIHQTAKKNADQVNIPDGYLEAGFHVLQFETQHSQISVSMELESAIALRESSRYPGEYRADVVDKFVGSGTFAKTWSLSGTFKKMSFFGKSDKVLKDYVVSATHAYQQYSQLQQYSPPEDILKISALGGLVEHLGTSLPTGVIDGDSELHLQIREKKLPGEELFNFISTYGIHSSTNPQTRDEITIDDFLEVVYEASLALLQYHFAGIVHRDVKPENINITTDLKCYLFDVNLSKKIDVDDKKVCGTLSYVSPEIIKGFRLTYKSDVFSLMRSLIIMLEREQPPLNQALNPNAFHPHYPVLTDLVNLNMLDRQHADLIIKMFDSAFQFDSRRRCDIDFILKQTEEIMWARRQQKAKQTMPPMLFEKFDLAHTAAKEIHDVLFSYKKSKDPVCGDKYIPKLVSDVNIVDMIKIKDDFSKKIDELHDDPSVIAEFCRTSGIRSIRNLKSKQLVKDEVLKIINGYTYQLSELFKLRSETTLLEKQRAINTILDLRKKYSFNLDNLKILADRFENAIRKLSVNTPTKRPNATLEKYSLLSQPIAIQPPTLAMPAQSVSQPDIKMTRGSP